MAKKVRDWCVSFESGGAPPMLPVLCYWIPKRAASTAEEAAALFNRVHAPRKYRIVEVSGYDRDGVKV